MRTGEPVNFEFWLLASGPNTSEAHVSQPRAEGRLPRIARLMALAIRFDGLIRSGAIRDYADLARLGGVSSARISQIMGLLNLAPDLQEQILFLARVVDAPDPITERALRKICGLLCWTEQRQLWSRLRADNRKLD
jgi:hypothetical protein